jgi:hypothetical protein
MFGFRTPLLTFCSPGRGLGLDLIVDRYAVAIPSRLDCIVLDRQRRYGRFLVPIIWQAVFWQIALCGSTEKVGSVHEAGEDEMYLCARALGDGEAVQVEEPIDW